jgi:hypothetical protein
MSRFPLRPRLDQATVKGIFQYLFGKGEGEKEFSESQYLDMRSDISGKQMFGALMYYRILHEQLGCKSAGDIADLLLRLSISATRGGRKEGVTVLLQNLPKETTIPVGIDPALIRDRE